MGLGPKIVSQRLNSADLITCTQCQNQYAISQFAPTKSDFYKGYIPICNNCINSYLDSHKWNWEYVDKLCQWADIPFIPKEWIKMQEQAGDEVFIRYAQLFIADQFENFGWGEYFEEFKRLKEERRLEDQIPEIAERKRKQLVKKWDGEYTDEEFDRLEELLSGMILTQNVNTQIQKDAALKLCKLSLEIDSQIREGGNIDKLLSSYEKLIKVADFTPKNSKSASDLESVGELCKWLEAGGWKNKFYDGVTRDIVDETITNMQAWTQRLYTNETGIGEEITRRIEALKIADQLERGQKNNYDLSMDNDLDKHDTDSYNDLFSDDEEEEFVVEIGEDSNYG